MVSVAMSKMGVTKLTFVDPGVKVNGQYLLPQYLAVSSWQMIPAIKQVAGDTFVFQQNSAPVHRARDTIQLLQRETPDFIGPDLWPPNSPDLNPADYKIWGVMQQRVYESGINRVGELKQRLTTSGMVCSSTSLTWLSASGGSD